MRDYKEASELYQRLLDAVNRMLHSAIGVKRLSRGVTDETEVRRIMQVRDIFARSLLVRPSEKVKTAIESVQRSITHLKRRLVRKGYFDWKSN